MKSTNYSNDCNDVIVSFHSTAHTSPHIYVQRKDDNYHLGILYYTRIINQIRPRNEAATSLLCLPPAFLKRNVFTHVFLQKFYILAV